jgi:hypothetical protein
MRDMTTEERNEAVEQACFHAWASVRAAQKMLGKPVPPFVHPEHAHRAIDYAQRVEKRVRALAGAYLLLAAEARKDRRDDEARLLEAHAGELSKIIEEERAR